MSDTTTHKKVSDFVVEEIRDRLTDYLDMITEKSPAAGADMYNCPLCGSGTGSHGTGALHASGRAWYCHSCNENGDIFDLIAKVNNIPFTDKKKDFPDVLDKAVDIFGYPTEDQTEKPKTAVNGSQSADNAQKDSDDKSIGESSKSSSQATTERDPERYREYITDCMDHVDDTSYFHDCGFTDRDIVENRLGYDPKRKMAVYPHGLDFDDFSYYIGRRLDARSIEKYGKCKKPKQSEAGKEPVFHGDYLRESKAPIFVVEGPKDAVAVRHCGGNCVALCGTGYDKLLTEIDKQKPTQPLILCLDHDAPDENGKTPGQTSQEKLVEELTKRNIVFTEMMWSFDRYPADKPQKDAADFLLADENQCKRDIQKAIRHADKPQNIHDYFVDVMSSDIERLKQDKGRKTGFYNLDKELYNVNSGVYVVCGCSAVGKTTLALQLSNNMCEDGNHVIYYSLEQSRLELASKAIVCQMYRDRAPVDSMLTSRQVREGTTNEDCHAALVRYMKLVGDRLSIYEANFSTTVPDIEAKTKCYIERNSVRPVVVIDYLQILPAFMDPDTKRKPTDTRQIIEQNITAIKKLSRSLSIPIIVLSSINRSYYNAPLSFEALKESGLIEFSSDCVLGLQLAAVDSDVMHAKTNDKNQAFKREYMKRARKELDRKIEVVCLKNRYGASDWSVFFDYFPKYDCFVPHDGSFLETDIGTTAPGRDPSADFSDLDDDQSDEDSEECEQTDLPLD